MLKVVILSLFLAVGLAINNGVGWLPPMGWSTWNTFRFNISSQLIREVSGWVAAESEIGLVFSYLQEFVSAHPKNTRTVGCVYGKLPAQSCWI